MTATVTALDQRPARPRAGCAPRPSSDRADRGEPLASWVRRAACAGRAAMFDDPAQIEDALALCDRCPVLHECRRWALHNAVDGVAGGMTTYAREGWRTANRVPEPTVSVDDFLPAEIVSTNHGHGRGRNDAIIAAVATWTANGASARDIGHRLGVTPRTINRLRTTCRSRTVTP